MKEIELYESHGFHLFTLRGKKPTVKEWQKTKFKENSFPSNYKGNFGVALQLTDLVIDVDPRGFKEHDKPHKRLASIVPELKHTLIVETGGGGVHIYFKKPIEIKIKKNLKDYQGIDFLSSGCYVVGAGSIHPDSKKPYKVVSGSFDKILPAPQALLDLIESKHVIERCEDLADFDDSKQTQFKFTKYLIESAPIAIEGKGGNNTTFKVACRGRDFGLSENITCELMWLHWSKSCEPEWEMKDLAVIVHNAYSYNQDPIGKFHPSNQFEPVEHVGNESVKVGNMDETVPTLTWHLTKQGDWQKNSIHNVCNFFKGYSETKELHNLLMFNTLSQNIEFTRRPFWIDKHEPVTAWDDNDANAVLKFLSTKLAFNSTKNLLHDTALAVAQENKFNPVIDFLESLKWDGKSRLVNWFSTYWRVEDSDYTRAVGELLLIAAIKRAYQAGCKYDYMVVVEGEQGVGKSTMINILGGKWYADLVLNVHSPDTVDCMRNKWIIEVSEMECTKRADTQAMRAFLSRSVDTCRLAYARTSKEFPRHNVFIGTFNPEPAGGYLKDITGDRRYFPVTVEGVNFLDFDKFKKDVKQLWAEAVVKYKANPDVELYLANREVFEQAKLETEKRRDKDSWIDPIAEWLNNPDGTGVSKICVSASEIFTHALGGSKERLGGQQFRRIANVMIKELGWSKSLKRVDGVVQRVYEKNSELIDQL